MKQNKQNRIGLEKDKTENLREHSKDYYLMELCFSFILTYVST